MTNQRSEADNLRRQLQTATSNILLQNDGVSARLQEAAEEEKRQAIEERQRLMAQISTLISAHAETQEIRMAERAAGIQKKYVSLGMSSPFSAVGVQAIEAPLFRQKM